MELWEAIRFLHVVALAFFVGGQLMLVVAIVPVLSGRDEERMLAIARRFGMGSGVAVVVLVGTGIALASHFSLWDDNTLQLKLLLVAVVGALTGMHIASPHSRAISVSLLVSTLLVVWLGVALSH